MTVAVGAACVLLGGLIVPAAVTTAQAGPSVQPRNGATPTTTYAVIRVIPVASGPFGVAVDQVVDLSPDGRFTWKRTTDKRTYVYFTGSGIQSNRVIIPAARP